MTVRHSRTGGTIDSAGRIVNIADAYDIFSQMKVVEYTPIIENKPTPGVTALRDKVDGPGSLTAVKGELKLDGALGLTACYTRKSGRYLPGLVGMAGVRVRMAEPIAGVTRYGYGNGMGNRVGMEVIDGAYKTYIESGGARWYAQDRANWVDPLDGTGPTKLDIPDLNGATLRIKFGHYGGLSFLFYLAIGRREGDIEVLIDSSGPRPGGVTLEQPDLPIFVETDSEVYVGGRQFGVFGRYKPQFRVTASGRVTKASVGTTFVPLVSFRIKNEARWQSVLVDLADAKASATGDGEYRIIVDSQLTLAGSELTDSDWASVPGIDENETAVEMNVTADAYTGGYKAESDLVIGGGGNRQGAITADLPDIIIPRNTIVTLAVAADSGTATFKGILKVREEW